MTGKVFPEGIAWDRLAHDYIAEFADLTEIEHRWSQYKNRHPLLTVFNYSAAEIMKASFADLVAIHSSLGIFQTGLLLRRGN